MSAGRAKLDPDQNRTLAGTIQAVAGACIFAILIGESYLNSYLFTVGSGPIVFHPRWMPVHLIMILLISPRTLFRLQGFVEGMLFGGAHALNITLWLTVVRMVNTPSQTELKYLVVLVPLAVGAFIFAAKTEKLLSQAKESWSRPANYFFMFLLGPLFAAHAWAMIKIPAAALAPFHMSGDYSGLGIWLLFILLDSIPFVLFLFCLAFYFIKARQIEGADLSINWPVMGGQWLGLVVLQTVISVLMKAATISGSAGIFDSFTPQTNKEWVILSLLLSAKYYGILVQPFLISALAPAEKSRKTRWVFAMIGIGLVSLTFFRSYLDRFTPENVPAIPAEISCDPQPTSPVTVISFDAENPEQLTVVETNRSVPCTSIVIAVYKGPFKALADFGSVVKKPEAIEWVEKMSTDPSVHHFARNRFKKELTKLGLEPEYHGTGSTISGHMVFEAWPPDRYPAQVELGLASNRHKTKANEDGDFMVRDVAGGIYSFAIIVEGRPLSDLHLHAGDIEVVNLPTAIEIFKEEQGERPGENVPGRVEMNFGSTLDLGEIVIRRKHAASEQPTATP